MNQSNTFVKHILSDLSATDNLCIVVEFMTWREAQMDDESRDLSVAWQAVTWTEARMRKQRELNTDVCKRPTADWDFVFMTDWMSKTWI